MIGLAQSNLSTWTWARQPNIAACRQWKLSLRGRLGTFHGSKPAPKYGVQAQDARS